MTKDATRDAPSALKRIPPSGEPKKDLLRTHHHQPQEEKEQAQQRDCCPPYTQSAAEAHRRKARPPSYHSNPDSRRKPFGHRPSPGSDSDEDPSIPRDSSNSSNPEDVFRPPEDMQGVEPSNLPYHEDHEMPFSGYQQISVSNKTHTTTHRTPVDANLIDYEGFIAAVRIVNCTVYRLYKDSGIKIHDQGWRMWVLRNELARYSIHLEYQ
ncbi:hypothetical protein PM082_000063 [Marasmius tenuissimus]|nr:hypothetical protein PM082_000063 [Marasmius tenuissimus]